MSTRNLRETYTRLQRSKYDTGTLDQEFAKIQRSIPIGAQSVAVTGAYTATPLDRTIDADATSAPFSVTVSPSTVSTEFPLTIKKTDASGNAVTIAGTIDGTTNPTLGAQWNSWTIISTGTALRKVASV